MPTHNLITLALVLNRRRYKETSLLVELFAANSTFYAGVAHGARRANSPLLGVLEPFAEVEVVLHVKPGSDFVVLKEASLVKMPPAVYDLPKAACLQAAAEIYRQLMFEHEEQHYQLLTSYKDYLPAFNGPPALLFYRFMLRLSANLGLPLNVNTCLECGQRGTFTAYYPQANGFICQKCFKPALSQLTVRLLEETGRILPLLPQIGNYAQGLELSPAACRQLSQVFLEHLRQHFQQKFYLKSLPAMCGCQ